jgi:hypothetical protein
LGNSGDYNMASGTLDRQMYRVSIDLERLDCSEYVLEVILRAWWFEAIRVPGYFEPEGFDRRSSSIQEKANQSSDLRENPPEHRYHWDEVPEHADPVKVATAIDILHKAGHLSDIDIQEQRFNRRVEEHYANLRKQNEWRDANGFSIGAAAAGKEAKAADDDEDEGEEGDNGKAKANGNGRSSRRAASNRFRFG